MNAEEKQAIRERLNMVTEGKWFTYHDESTVVGSFENHTDTPVAECFTDDDAIFIANSKQDIPRLLDAMDAAEREVERLKEEIRSHAPEGRNYTNAQYMELLLENQRLRNALEEISQWTGDDAEIARQALAGEEK